MKKRNVMDIDLYKSFKPEKGSKVVVSVRAGNMSIAEIYDRFRKGRPTVGAVHHGYDQEIPVSGDGRYQNPDEHPDMEALDRLEPFERREEIRRVGDLHRKMKGDMDAIERAAAKKREERDREDSEMREAHRKKKSDKDVDDSGGSSKKA